MSLVQFRVEGAVALVRLDRPPVNALSSELSADLSEAFGRCEDDSIRAVVVTGHPHFAAGADIKGFQAAYESGSEEKLASTLVETVWRLERLAKPTIAAIHGYALGGGLELAMGCDFRFLADDAQVFLNLNIILTVRGIFSIPESKPPCLFQAHTSAVVSGLCQWCG